jgi:ATP-dependent Clp protease ATP-binding subunit ClpA
MSGQTRLSKELEGILSSAVDEAVKRRHEYVTLEHLLYAMLADEKACDILYHCGANLGELWVALDNYLETVVEKLPKGYKAMPELTLVFQSTIQHAILQVESSQKNLVDVGNILAAMYQVEHSYAVQLLKEQGISRLDILNYISHRISKIVRIEEEENSLEEIICRRKSKKRRQ